MNEALMQFYMWMQEQLKKRQRMQVPMSGAGVPMGMGQNMGSQTGNIPGVNGSMPMNPRPGGMVFPNQTGGRG